ncbi:UDP-glucose/GDP-mannose dehydrogenase family protein [Pontibacillus sp. HMF3514]|uniref:UDP-glucose dehydrogenase family protein n=1 Tax=Pontibacillus sp. HMF3514 TaxID=2692425 RepID=UPI00131F5FB5|nr:UDP-glucose/GDP-mannose dehydrogenase family protein [Pontibacillus sp. HMF3514]QHE53739.1 nucleotide sugar dehydrogenase [Pontibacillus sp. HMF3514]
MKIAVVGTGYVGLVTGVCLSEVGHEVTCIDIDKDKVEKMRAGISPIYEPALDEMMLKNIEENRLFFTTQHQKGFEGCEAIYIAVGTPELEDGSADLSFVEKVGKDIAAHVVRDTIVVTKSTVPVGTNDWLKQVIKYQLAHPINVEVVSNPEFLREGSAIYDTFHGDRIVIGTESEHAANVLEEINKPFGLPIIRTDIRSAEMIKYASNAFLATKISFINEISNICEKLGANVNDVAFGMGQDSRIGNQFLNPGIGYGGSCFPKDTKALVQIAGNVDYDFNLLKGVIEVNQKQQAILLEKLKERFGSLLNKKIAILGLSFKPNTDDMREAASIVLTNELVNQGAQITAYDPIAMDNARTILDEKVQFAASSNEAIKGSDAVLLLTEWEEFKGLNLSVLNELMEHPVLFDGRNCFDLGEAQSHNIEYYSMGRPSVVTKVTETV